MAENRSLDEHKTAQNIRVLIVDDHALVRAGFRVLLQELGYDVVGEGQDGEEALDFIAKLQPDIVLMDIAMSKVDGLEATARARKTFPRVRVIILSMHANVEYARRALLSGAAGYVLKDSKPAELDTAIRMVMDGRVYLSSGMAKFVRTDPAAARLSPRQLSILRLLVKGYTRKQIAKQLNISVKTFDTYRAQIMETLQLHDTSDLVKYVAETGL